MDDYNVHHLWGSTPYINLLDVADALKPQQQGGAAATEPLRLLQVRCACCRRRSLAVSVAPRCDSPVGATLTTSCQSNNLFQVCPYDGRHTIATLAAACARDAGAAASAAGGGASSGSHDAEEQQQMQQQQPWLQLCVYEDEPQLLARHMLLAYALLSGASPPAARPALLLELHGSALLSARAGRWLAEASGVLEDAVALSLAGGGGGGGGDDALAEALSRAQLAGADDGRPPRDAGAGAGAGAGARAQKGDGDSKAAATAAADERRRRERRRRDAARLAALFDLSRLKIQQRDALAEALRRWRPDLARYDMVAAWDARCRRWFGDRYDSRANLVSAPRVFVLVSAASRKCLGRGVRHSTNRPGRIQPSPLWAMLLFISCRAKSPPAT